MDRRLIGGILIFILVGAGAALHFSGALNTETGTTTDTETPQEKLEDTQSDTNRESRQLIDCSRYRLEIVSATDETATIQQTSGNNGIGALYVTWYYEDGSTAQNTEVSIDQSMGATEASSDAEGTLTEVVASSQTCQSVDARYEPSTR